ncbi:MAG: LysR family transcriptional regulator [Deltaproteobacteria bacterium]|nr:LysR family transcriptional regulator [Deltaproteobacteria bacterium]
MDLRQCRVFVEVARKKSFTRAANRLHIAQPAVSMTIRKLEEDLGLVLISRKAKQICLTAEGEVFLRHAQRILANCAAAQSEMAELQGLTRGEVRIGIPPMMSAYYFPQVIRKFIHRYPHLNLSVYGDGAASIQKMIAHGDIDLGVITGGKIPQGLESQRFLREEIVAVVPTDHPFAKRDSISMEDFYSQPLILFKAGYYMRELINDLALTCKIQPRIVFETNLFSLVRSLIKEGLGVSTLLRMAVANEPTVKAIPFDPPQHLDLLIAWQAESYLSHANRAFVDFLLSQATEINKAMPCPAK